MYLNWGGGGGTCVDWSEAAENEGMEPKESLNRPFSAAKSSSERDKIGDGEERLCPAGMLSGLSDGAEASPSPVSPDGAREGVSDSPELELSVFSGS